MIPDIQEETHTGSFSVVSIVLYLFTIFLVFLTLSVLTIFLFSRAPHDFPQDASIVIAPGSSVAMIAEQFKEEGFVRSSNLLYAALVLEYDTANIHAGTYLFFEPLTVRQLARHIVEVGPDEELLKLTFPEGIRVDIIAAIASKELKQFDASTFLSIAREKEGYFFPDTYFVPETFSHDELYNLMLETGRRVLDIRENKIKEHTLTEYEILILASIIEREAKTEESMKTVSGILQNRLAINMALQADASIEYILDKPLGELVPEDLKIDSPYNTYLYTGLPPTPIGNPGAQAIDAVLEPNESNYFYYITDADGVFHYAETFDEHKLNIAQFLR